MKSFNRWSLPAILLLFCALCLAGCSGPKPHAPKTAEGADSTAHADSASASTPVAQAASLTYEQQQGKILYTKYCTICHGDAGKGDGFNAYSLDPKPRDFTDTRAMAGMDDATLMTTVTEGGRGVNKSPLMPAWGGRLNKLEIDYVLQYVKALEQQH